MEPNSNGIIAFSIIALLIIVVGVGAMLILFPPQKPAAPAPAPIGHVEVNVPPQQPNTVNIVVPPAVKAQIATGTTDYYYGSTK